MIKSKNIDLLKSPMIGKYFAKIPHFLLNSKEMPIYMNIRAIRHIIKSTVFVDITIANGRKA